MYFQFSWIVIAVVATLCISLLWPKKPFMSNLRGKHLFLTGASSGIGLEIAKQALREGAYLTLVARNGEKMGIIAKSLLKQLECSPEQVLVKVQEDILVHSTCVENFDIEVQWKNVRVCRNRHLNTRVFRLAPCTYCLRPSMALCTSLTILIINVLNTGSRCDQLQRNIQSREGIV